MTRGEVERIIAPYVKRIEALEKEVAELKNRPAPFTIFIGQPSPSPDPTPGWPLPRVICDVGTAKISA